MELGHRGRFCLKGEGPRLQESAAGPQAREVYHEAVSIAPDGNLLSIHGELKIGENIKRKRHNGTCARQRSKADPRGTGRRSRPLRPVLLRSDF